MTSLSVPGGHFTNVSGLNAGKEKRTLVADCFCCICTALGRKPPRVRTWHQYQSPAIQRPPPSLLLSIANLEISIADHIRSIVTYKLLEIGKFIPEFGKGFIVIVCEMEMRVNGFVPICLKWGHKTSLLQWSKAVVSDFFLLLFQYLKLLFFLAGFFTSPLNSKLALNADVMELFGMFDFYFKSPWNVHWCGWMWLGYQNHQV